MVQRCCIDNCKRGWVDGKFRGFKFPFKKRHGIIDQWIKFVNKKDWNPSDNCSLCYEHFDPAYIVRGIRWTLNLKLDPVPTLYPPILECTQKRKCVIVARNLIKKKNAVNR